MIFATDFENWHSLAQTEYLKLMPQQNEQRKSKQAIIDAQSEAYRSMLPIWSKVAERHLILARMAQHAKQDPEYFWTHINEN